jgi:hypothetical protein
MQVLATKTGSELKLTKREKALLEDCKAFVELLGKHGDKGMAESAAKVVLGIGNLQFAIDPPSKEDLPY